jgi:polyisoprenyl-teichoic acid--peptidoglycan teichoic acid transferase
MQRRSRRVTSRQRNPRAARNPAYQIRPRVRLAPESPEAGDTASWQVEPAIEPDDGQWRKPTEQPTTAIPEETSYQPDVREATVDDEGSTGDLIPEVLAPETTAPTIESAGVTTPALPPSAEPAEDFSTYVRKIEEAAARSRAERRGAALAGHRPIANVEHHPATAVTPQQSPAVRRGGPSAPRPSGQGGNRGGRGRPQPVQQPFFRRRRTWLVILALAFVPVLVAALYTSNVLRLGISAYQDIHTSPEDRIRYRVNAMGTPEAIPTEEAKAALPNWGANEVVNIVLMGIDVRSHEDESIRSDTIIVVHVDPQDGEMAMMSIPRDLRVYIPEFGHDKMNAAYAIGDAHQDTIPGGGPTLVAQTIEANFNIPIHYYATVDFHGFQKIVDTVGGVIIDVQNQLSDNLYPTEDLRLTRIYFGTGPQNMNGEAALQYVRTRHADSDLARGQRQQQVLLAIRERAVVRDLITRAPDLIEDVGDTLRTDLDFNQMLALANLGRQVDSEKITRVDLWQEGILFEHFPDFEGDAYYLDADWDRIHELQEEFFEVPEPVATPTPDALASGIATPAADTGPTATPTEIATEPDFDTPVMVENGTNVPALAGHTAQFLFDSGFRAVWASDADEPATDTVIYDSSNNGLTARYLADLLGLSRDVIVQRAGNDDILVVIGDDFPEELIPAPTP